MQFPAIRPIILVVEYDPLELTWLAMTLSRPAALKRR